MASGFIQWKGTTVCMDVECDCGAGFHVDAEFAYFIRCPECHAVLKMGTQIGFSRATVDEIESAGVIIEPDAVPG